MSHVFQQIKQYRNYTNRYDISTSNINTQSRAEGDSRPHLGQCITNTPSIAGTFIGLIAFVILGGVGLFNTHTAFATVSTLSISIDDPTLDFNVGPGIKGTFVKSSPSTITASTNNATGYTLTIAAGDTSDTYNKLKAATSGNTDTISSITTDTEESAFKALDGTSYNNMWGYLSYKKGESNTTYLPSPGKGIVSSPADTIATTKCANGATDPSTGQACPSMDQYELVMGARVDTTIRLDSYANTYVVSLVANAIPYSITYIDNTVTNMPVDMSGTSDTENITIANNTPIRNGYTFIGWCKGTVVNNANGTDTCNGTTIAVGGTTTIDETSTTNNIVLYAMWSGNYTISGITTMQQLGTMSMENKSKVISTMVTDANYTLKDVRDNQNYTVSKLRDGQVWMTRNLNLAGNTTLNAGTSDVNANYTLPASSETGFSSDTTAYVYNSGNTSNCGASGQNVKCYSYYSYIAATAGSGASVTGDGQDAPWSICPKGWRLPTSGNHTDTSSTSITGYKRGDFYKLATAYGVNLENQYYENSATFYNNLGPGTNANFLLSGYYNGSTFYNGGVVGNYWSSTGGSSTSDARDLSFLTGRVRSASNNSRRLGFSVRCVLGS